MPNLETGYAKADHRNLPEVDDVMYCIFFVEVTSLISDDFSALLFIDLRGYSTCENLSKSGSTIRKKCRILFFGLETCISRLI